MFDSLQGSELEIGIANSEHMPLSVVLIRRELPTSSATASASDGRRNGRLGSVNTSCDSSRAVYELVLKAPSLSDTASPQVIA
jgi:hypothetical protein